jgi:hypothetical protein
MAWLWIAGPVVAGLVFVLTDRRDKRLDTELARWRARMAPPGGVQKQSAGYRDAKEVDAPPGAGPKVVEVMPAPFTRMVLAAGGGQRRALFELAPKLAYFTSLGGDVVAGSDQHTVVAKLEERAPSFTVRPLPILDGLREPNTGVAFKKDDEFMESFLVDRYVEGTEAQPPAPTEALDKPIRAWLSPPVRAALLELPDAWLRVEGKMMALTLYGPADADRLHDLITAADVIFAEYGAEGGPSLFGEDDEEEAAPAPPPKKAAGKKPSPGKSA